MTCKVPQREWDARLQGASSNASRLGRSWSIRDPDIGPIPSLVSNII